MFSYRDRESHLWLLEKARKRASRCPIKLRSLSVFPVPIADPSDGVDGLFANSNDCGPAAFIHKVNRERHRRMGPVYQETIGPGETRSRTIKTFAQPTRIFIKFQV